MLPAAFMKLTDLNRDGGIGANSLLVQLGEQSITSGVAEVLSACNAREKRERESEEGGLTAC